MSARLPNSWTIKGEAHRGTVCFSQTEHLRVGVFESLIPGLIENGALPERYTITYTTKTVAISFEFRQSRGASLDLERARIQGVLQGAYVEHRRAKLRRRAVIAATNREKAAAKKRHPSNIAPGKIGGVKHVRPRADHHNGRRNNGRKVWVRV